MSHLIIKEPIDKNFDNTYDLEVAYVAPDKTRHETHLAVTVNRYTLYSKDRGGGRHSFFPPSKSLRPNLPSRGYQIYIRGLAFDMPWTGPLIITMGA